MGVFLGLFFIIITFFPIFDFGIVRIPTTIFLLLFLFLKKKIVFDRKLIIISFISILAFLLLNMVHFIGHRFVVKDLSYCFIIVTLLLNYILMSNLITKKNLPKLIRVLKIFLVVQMIFCLLEMTNLFHFNEVFNDLLFFFQQNNAQKMNSYLEVSYRPFGTMGSPIFLSFVAYLFGRTIQLYTGNKKYYYLSFVIIFLTGARTALIGFLAIEIFYILFVQFKKNPKQCIKNLLLLSILFGLVYQFTPFVKKSIDLVFNQTGGLSNDYSFTYRLSMFQIFLDNLKYAFLGGMSIYSFPDYVDSEYILRILQFGIVGFTILVFPYLYLFFDSMKSKVEQIGEVGGSILLFTLFSMLTANVLTNVFYIPFFCIYFIVAKKMGERE